jgi:hypothetical protein
VDHEPELLGDQPVRLPRARREPVSEGLDVEQRELWRVPWHKIPWRIVVAVVLVVAVGALAWHADQRERRRETASLTECRRLLHSATIFTDLQMASVASNGIARQDVLAGMLSRPAQQLLPDVVHADRVCRSVSVKPWHRSLTGQRDAATAYSAALAAKLRAVAADGHEYFHDNPSLRRLRKAADIGVLGGRY